MPVLGLHFSMDNSARASPSLEIKHGDSTHPENQEKGSFSPLIHSNLDSQWLNHPFSVDALACSMERLCLSDPATDQFCGFTTDPIPANGQFSGNNALGCVPNWSTQHMHGGQFLEHHNLSSLEDVKARLASLAQQRRQHLGKPEVIEMILWQVKDHLCDLMMDQHCTYLIQSIFEASSVDHITRIVALVVRNEHKLKEVCTHNYGTRAMQKLLDYVKTPEQISTALSAVKRITVILSKSINGSYIIQHCYKLFSPTVTKFIIEEVARNCVEIVADKSGCSVFQKYLHLAKGDALKRLVEGIASYAFVLADHPLGNYVVQCVVRMKKPYINGMIIAQLRGNYAQLCMNKHASNVVEGLLEFSEERDAATIIQEIMYNRNFVAIVQDTYGNYVVQRALKKCKGTLNKMLSSIILSNYPHLHSHLYGKRVLASIQRRRICAQRRI